MSSSQPPPNDAERAESAGISRQQLMRRGLAASLALSGAGALAQNAPAAPRARRATVAAQVPDGFNSRVVRAGGLRQHVVIGGDGPPLLLVHGWPETWYAWRLILPALARDFQVIAPDQRGMGQTDKPLDGYDTATLANDLAALMDVLGHARFAVVGHDTGMDIAYALAADHPDRVAQVGLAEAPLPGATKSPDLFLPGPVNARLWHLTFNRLAALNEQLVTGREDLFFGYEFDIFTAKKFPAEVVQHYVDHFASSPDALRGSFGFYRAIDATMAQNADRATRKLSMPVLGIGGQFSLAEQTALSLAGLANEVQTAVIAGAGHFIAEEAPDEVVAALTAFLSPYRDA